MTRADVRLLKRNRAWGSKLTPYADLIQKLRRRGKTYREIAQRLREAHGIEISHNGVYSFVKARKRTRLIQPKKPTRPKPKSKRIKPTIPPPPPPITQRKRPILLNEFGKEIPPDPFNRIWNIKDL